MAPATATTEVTTADTSDNKPQEQAKVLDYNPRGKGYIYIAFTSLVCFASVCNVKKGRNEYSISLAIGAVTFGLSVFILLLDRAQGCFESFKFHKSMDGKLEGFTLLFFVIWWVIGVCIMTQSGGIAYSAINVYFSSWLALGACCYTLNDWSGSKDIITIQELTALSMTLRGWYGLLFSSIVVMGSASDMHRFLISDGPTQEASFAIALGIISLIVSAMCILAHYRVLPFPPVGGFIELSITSILIILWILGVGILTQDGSVAASITGQCAYNGENYENPVIPGSNLYVFTWLCLVSSVEIALGWKATQAMSFAQAAKGEATGRKGVNSIGDDEDNEDDDEDGEL